MSTEGELSSTMIVVFPDPLTTLTFALSGMKSSSSPEARYIWEFLVSVARTITSSFASVVTVRAFSTLERPV